MSLSISLHPERWRTVSFILLLYPSICYGQRVTLPRGNQQSIIVLLAAIERQTHLAILYSPATLRRMPAIDVNLPPNMKAGDALNMLLAGLRLYWNAPSPGVITIRGDTIADAIYMPLTVLVTNSENEPLTGASVSLPNEGKTWLTDNNGMLSRAVNGFVTTLTISYAGYAPKTLNLSNKIPINRIVLEPPAGGLDEVHVIAYGSTTRRLATGSEVSVKGEEIQSQTDENLLDGLEGIVPGLFIRHYNGVPGSSYDVQVRGLHSLQQGNYPLIVVDGIPLADNGGTLTTVGSGSAQGSSGASILNSIPPDMIKSMEVLKGADATTLYGSRAANGVLLITLKDRTSRNLRINADFDGGGSRPVKTSPLLNTTQFLALRREAVVNDSLPADSATLPEQYYWGSARNTDFKKTVMGGTGQQYHGSVDLSWSEKNTSFLLSGSTLERSSVFPGSTADDRQSVYGQWQYQSPDKKWQVGGAGLYSYEGNKLPVQDYTGNEVLAPNAPPFSTPEGQPQWMYNGLSYTNILALENNSYRSGVSSTFVHCLVHYTLPWTGFGLETRIGYNSIAASETSRQPVSGQAPVPTPTGQMDWSWNDYNSQLIEPMVKYSHTVGPGRLDGVAGVTWQAQNAHLESISEDGFASDVLMQTGAVAPTTIVRNVREYYRYDAAFGRMIYNLHDEYILSGSLRRDGSSREPPADRYGDFWSVAAAWILPWLPYAKLHGSYGTTGNDEIGNTGYTEVYNPTSAARGYQGSTLQGVSPDSLYNSNIHWEVSRMIEASFDLGLWQNRLVFSATGYYSRSSNQLVTLKLASQAGRPGVLANQPIAVVNEGLEFQLQMNGRSGKIRWSWQLNATLPRNRLASYPGLATSTYAKTLVVGRPIDATQAYHFTGINPQKGVYTFKGQDSTGAVSTNDLTASPAPDQRCYGSWTNVFQYKGWRLEIQWQFVVQDGENPLGILYLQNPPGVEAASQLSNGPVQWLNHWRYPGDPAKLQMVSSVPVSAANYAAYTYVQSDANIVDASYLRLRQVALSYQLPKKTKGRLKECRIYIRGENLWTGTRFPVSDPETQDPTVLPVMRTVLAGIQFTF